MNLKKIRKSRKITQVEAAEYLGVNHSLICKYETGHISPSIDKLKKLAKLYQVSLEELTADDPDEIEHGSILCMGRGVATIGSTTTDKDGNVIQHTPSSWKPAPDGACVAIWTADFSNPTVPTSQAELFGAYDHAGILKYVRENLDHSGMSNLTPLEEMIKRMLRSDNNFCFDYCGRADCGNCIVHEWKTELRENAV